MQEMRPSFIRGAHPLPPECQDTQICTRQRAICPDCADHTDCPERVPRPIRPAWAWRPSVSRADQPLSTRIVRQKDVAEMRPAFVTRIREIAPEER
ncbi:MAG: DUF1272 domain-containing protein [Pseudomonadota bacterium]